MRNLWETVTSQASSLEWIEEVTHEGHEWRYQALKDEGRVLVGALCPDHLSVGEIQYQHRLTGPCPVDNYFQISSHLHSFLATEATNPPQMVYSQPGMNASRLSSTHAAISSTSFLGILFQFNFNPSFLSAQGYTYFWSSSFFNFIHSSTISCSFIPPRILLLSFPLPCLASPSFSISAKCRLTSSSVRQWCRSYSSLARKWPIVYTEAKFWSALNRDDAKISCDSAISPVCKNSSI